MLYKLKTEGPINAVKMKHAGTIAWSEGDALAFTDGRVTIIPQAIFDAYFAPVETESLPISAVFGALKDKTDVRLSIEEINGGGRSFWGARDMTGVMVKQGPRKGAKVEKFLAGYGSTNWTVDGVNAPRMPGRLTVKIADAGKLMSRHEIADMLGPDEANGLSPRLTKATRDGWLETVVVDKIRYWGPTALGRKLVETFGDAIRNSFVAWPHVKPEIASDNV